MESLLNKRFQKKKAKQMAEEETAPLSEQPQKKKDVLQNVKEIDNQSMSSTQSASKKKEKVPLADTKRGKALDIAAAFVGLPHICSNE